MDNKGIIRKIDTLGRIVIPIEIRNYLNINANDSIEILPGANCLLLKKYSLITSYKDRINKIIDIMPKIDATVIVSDRDKIINTCIYENKDLSNELVSIMNENKEYKTSNLECLTLGTININCFYLCLPINIDYSTVGLIILISNDKITKEDEIYSYCLKNIIENISCVI